jgi:prophage antirepressor-like protein
MSQVAGPSDHDQENNVHENALVGARTQYFQLGTQNHKVRVLGTHEDPWFVAEDIGRVLGVQNMRDSLKNYRKGKERDVGDVYTPGGIQQLLIMSERAVYKFINRSHKAEAEPFQDWVADVLKTIRLEGRYQFQSSQSKLLEDNAAFQKKTEAAEREAQEAKTKLLEAEKVQLKQAEKLEELRRRIRDQHQKGQTVYLLRNPSDRETKKWKVGKTKDMSNRECQYTTAMPDGPEIVHCRHTRDSALVERVCLHILKSYRYEEGHEWMVGDPEYFARVIDCVVNFVDGMTDAGETIVDYKLHKRVDKLMGRAKDFDAEAVQDELSDLEEGSNGSVIISGNVLGNVNITMVGDDAFFDFLKYSGRVRHDRNSRENLEDVRKAFGEAIGKAVKRIDRQAFKRVHPEYLVVSVKKCKTCGSDKGSGCCQSYSNMNRTSVQHVLNMRLLV